MSVPILKHRELLQLSNPKKQQCVLPLSEESYFIDSLTSPHINVNAVTYMNLLIITCPSVVVDAEVLSLTNA